MTLPSDMARNRRHGVSLIEAMVAMAILALVLGAALSGTGWTVGQVAARTDRAWLSELARSVADEYAITRDPSLLQGEASPDWRWRIDERTQDDGLTEITVTTWRSLAPDRTVTLSLLAARGTDAAP
jgi:prepilin-type N-terminal cleavage/methylation domain-containing protein